MFPLTAPFLAAGLALGIATSSGAQVVRLSEFDGRQSPRPHGRMSPPPAPGAFGGDIQQRMIPVAEFTPEQSGYSYQNNLGSTIRPTAAGLQRWIAPLRHAVPRTTCCTTSSSGSNRRATHSSERSFDGGAR